MKIASIGGGPAGLYFSLLAKKNDPRHEITVYERNGPDDTFGWGVVFSDQTLAALEAADPDTHRAMTAKFTYWSDIDIFVGGERVRSTGHGFCGLSRRTLLNILQARCRELGVELLFQREVGAHELPGDFDLVLAADGVNSAVRDRYAAHFQPELDWRRCKFCWLGTDLPLEAFTFFFKKTEHGLFQVHAYPFEPGKSTFIVECREHVWRRAGLDNADEARTVAFLEELFHDELGTARLFTNRSVWRTFPTVRNARWHHGRFVLIGDAAHTAHFSIGSGTKLAMEDAIALAEALARQGGDAPGLLPTYEAARRPAVSRIQRAAQTSLEWFENAARYVDLPVPQFSFGLLSRSKRITYERLRERDPGLVERVTAWFEGANPHSDAEVPPPAYAGAAVSRQRSGAVPPSFQRFRLREMTLANRLVVSPMCQYSALHGQPGDWHLVHLGSRAVGGAGLILTESTHVSAEARISPGCAGLYEDGHERAWRQIVEFVQRHSVARIGVQLAHSGRKGSSDLPWRGGRPLSLAEGGWETQAPSPLAYDLGWPTPRPMARSDMHKVRDDFVSATERAARVGFDMLELHMAHGYLLASFLSPLTNQRDDEYGGSLDNRMRFPLEIFDSVRAVWPAERPISVRLSATDWKAGGVSSLDRLTFARELKSHGCDIIDVSGGQTVPDQEPVYGRMYLAAFSDEIRHEVGVPTMTVGNIQGIDQCHTLLAAGRADLCVLARGHLKDPYFTLRGAASDGFDGQYWPPQYWAARPSPQR